MGELKPYHKSVRFIAVFSRYRSHLDWFWLRVKQEWGEPLSLSPTFAFAESEYYRPTMGDELLKQFAVLDAQYDPASLASDKILTNRWEEDAKRELPTTEPRPLNIDPGYMTLTKLVLASTKNREHRIYLRDNVYAEVTLGFRDQRWQPMPWTYPDYQRRDFLEYFLEARRVLLGKYP
ncbi:MAG: DUF4416 family protein [Pirellula sp.]|jgi:hypothetical protein|nr:DUF4416 family protein [Pirellula sp.]